MTTNFAETAPNDTNPRPTAVRDRVVVGVDDDIASITALHAAATEAAYRGADVEAVHVWQLPFTWGAPLVWTEEDYPTVFIGAQLQERIDKTLAARALAGERKVSITARVLEGAPAPVLRAVSEGAVLLVLGARHHSRFLGSVSSACASHPPCAVLIVPAPPESG